MKAEFARLGLARFPRFAFVPVVPNRRSSFVDLLPTRRFRDLGEILNRTSSASSEFPIDGSPSMKIPTSSSSAEGYLHRGRDLSIRKCVSWRCARALITASAQYRPRDGNLEMGSEQMSTPLTELLPAINQGSALLFLRALGRLVARYTSLYTWRRRIENEIGCRVVSMNDGAGGEERDSRGRNVRVERARPYSAESGTCFFLYRRAASFTRFRLLLGQPTNMFYTCLLRFTLVI